MLINQNQILLINQIFGFEDLMCEKCEFFFHSSESHLVYDFYLFIEYLIIYTIFICYNLGVYVGSSSSNTIIYFCDEKEQSHRPKSFKMIQKQVKSDFAAKPGGFRLVNYCAQSQFLQN